jgi:hypothetical protein
MQPKWTATRRMRITHLTPCPTSEIVCDADACAPSDSFTQKHSLCHFLTAHVGVTGTLHGGRRHCVRLWVKARRRISSSSKVIAKNEIARLFLRIRVRHLWIIGWNSGRYIGKFGLSADSSGQKIPGLHLGVAYNLRSERAIDTYQEPCGCQRQPTNHLITTRNE